MVLLDEADKFVCEYTVLKGECLIRHTKEKISFLGSYNIVFVITDVPYRITLV